MDGWEWLMTAGFAVLMMPMLFAAASLVGADAPEGVQPSELSTADAPACAHNEVGMWDGEEWSCVNDGLRPRNG